MPYGNKVWDRRYGGYGGDYSTNLLPSPDGGYFLIGNSGSIAGYDKSQANVSEHGWISDFWVLKLDEHGNKANTLYDPGRGCSHMEHLRRRGCQLF